MKMNLSADALPDPKMEFQTGPQLLVRKSSISPLKPPSLRSGKSWKRILFHKPWKNTSSNPTKRKKQNKDAVLDPEAGELEKITRICKCYGDS